MSADRIEGKNIQEGDEVEFIKRRKLSTELTYLTSQAQPKSKSNWKVRGLANKKEIKYNLK